MDQVILWQQSMSVGNHQIDAQHRKLLDTYNLVSELANNPDQDLILAALDEVVEYTLIHFSCEEEVLKKNLYPKFDSHKTEHDAIRECVHTIAKNRSLVNQEMLSDVMKRLVKHILENDRAYSGHAA